MAVRFLRPFYWFKCCLLLSHGQNCFGFDFFVPVLVCPLCLCVAVVVVASVCCARRLHHDTEEFVCVSVLPVPVIVTGIILLPLATTGGGGRHTTRAPSPLPRRAFLFLCLAPAGASDRGGISKPPCVLNASPPNSMEPAGAPCFIKTRAHASELECTRANQDGPGWTRMDQDGPGWTRMDQNGPEWTRMDQNGPEWT